MNTDELINCGARGFEQLCLRYAQKKYDKDATIVLTPPTQDGGRDIEITFPKNDFVHWGECKHHTRNIDLSTIGKNIVLVMSYKVRKIIFFSTSEIVYNTKKEILKIAKEYKFEAVFLDGENLFSELIHYNLLTDNGDEIDQNYKIKIYAEEAETSGGASNYVLATENSLLSLKSSGYFSLYIIIENRYFNRLKVVFKFLNDPEARFSGLPNEFEVSVPPFSDQSLKISMYTSLRYRESDNLPDIYVSALGKTKIFKIGKIQADFYPLVPLIGQETFDKVNLIKNQLKDRSSINLIDVRGEKGVGKSRLVSEALAEIKKNCPVYFVSSKYQDDLSEIKRLIADIIKIPFDKNESIEKPVFDTILNSIGFDSELRESVYKYFTNHTSVSNWERKKIYSYVLNRIFEYPFVLVFEDADNAAKETLYFLNDLLERLKNVDAKNLKVIVTGNYVNSNRYSKKSNYSDYKLLQANLDKLHILKNNKPIFCYELSESDKILYCLEILGTNERQCADLITKNFPGNPSVLNSICFPLISLALDERISIINKILCGSGKNKIATLSQELFNHKLIGLKIKEYYNEAISLIKYISLFNGAAPLNFIQSIKFDRQTLDEMIGERLIQFDINSHTYGFYQTCYINYIKNNSILNKTKTEANKVIKWIDKRTDNNYAEVKFNCLLATGQTEKACDFGYDTVMSDKYCADKNSYKLIEALLKQQSLKRNVTKNYILTKKLAHIYLFNNNFKQGLKFFSEAYALAQKDKCDISCAEFCQIRHEYINSLIHNAKYSEVLNFMGTICAEKIELLKYKFLYYNRLGVINTFLYNIKDAELFLSKAQSVAIQMNDAFILSTNYSDYAYLYMKTNRKEEAVSMFENATNLYSECEYSEMYRDIEINDQFALAFAFKEDFETAEVYIDKSLKICQDNYRDYTLLKTSFIKAYISVCQKLYKQAEILYNDCITRAKIFGSEIYTIYSYAGLSALKMLQNKQRSIDKYFNIINKFFIDNKFEGEGAKLAILKNFALWFCRTENLDKLNQIKSLDIPEINEYINKLTDKSASVNRNITKWAQVAANIDGYSFLF